MRLSRREFLSDSGLAAAYLLLPAWLSACGRSDVSGAAPTAVATAAQQLATPEAWANTRPGLHADIIHLLNRITYGPRPGEVERIAAMGWDAFLDQQLNPERIDDTALEQRLAPFKSLTMRNADLLQTYVQGKNEAGPKVRLVIQELEAASLLRAIYSERQLFELMVDFWSNHFNIFIGKGLAKWLKTSDDRDVIRAHALGKFRDLLLASAKSPAMLFYLDNAENVKPGVQVGKRAAGINENYARELLELHTVGVDGGYTQDDVIAVAHAFTGWSINRRNQENPGEFVFRLRLHDDSAIRVPFLNLDLPAGGGMKRGEMVLERLASHPKTAARIAYKLAFAFVSDDPPPALVQRAAQTFLDSDTDIRATLGVILRSDEFRATAGQKIKLPLRVLASATRGLGAEVTGSAVGDLLPLIRALQGMGQAFFAWGAPNGYPQAGAAWINASGMLSRWNMAFALSEGRIKGVRADLHPFVPAANSGAGALVDGLSAALLPVSLAAPARDALVAYVAEGADAQQPLLPDLLKRKLPELAGLLLASPGFQMY